MKSATLCFLLLFAPLVVNAQTRDVALVVAECVPKSGLCTTQELAAYHFRNGLWASREVIVKVDTGQVRFDLGKNHIYRNRYVITRWGDVVDIRKKAVLHDGEGDYVAIENDRIIQHVSKIDLEGYFYFNLNTNQYRRLEQPGKWALPGLLSPDQTRSLETPKGNRIWLHDLIEKKRLLGEGFTVGSSMEASFMPSPPVFWLDDWHILSQRSNGEIVLVKLNGTVTPIARIPINEENYSEPFFFRDPAGRIIYYCSDRSFVINVEERSYEPREWVALGFGFEAEDSRNKSYGHIIRYQGKEIGRWWASVWQAQATDGYVAFEYGNVGSNLGYPKGIKVWSSANGNWTTLDKIWPVAIVGWISE